MAKVSILLEKLAKDFGSPDNEILKAAEHDEQILNIVASALINCAHVLASASVDVLKFEPHIDTEDLEALSLVASDFDQDEELGKYADSIDNLLSLISKKSSYDDFSREVFEEDVLSMSLDELYKLKEGVIGDLKFTNVALAELESQLYSDDEDDESRRLLLLKKMKSKERQLYYSEEKLKIINERINKKTSESINDIGNLATAFDETGDDSLSKIASVLDEILLTIAKPKNAIESIKLAEEAEIEKLRAKYKKNPEDLFTLGNDAKQKLADEYTKEINDKVKTYKPMEHALSTRHCPEHYGQSIARIGEGIWQCPLDKKIYDFNSGYKLMDGSIIPPSSVQNQTDNLQNHVPEHVSFSNREQKLNDNG